MRKKRVFNKILLVGATGFIGSAVLERLLNENFKVVVLKRTTSNTERIHYLLNKVKVYDIDVCDPELPFKENKIDIVINLVTNYGRGKDVLPSEVVETNLSFCLKMVEAAVEGGAKYYFNLDSSLNPKVNLYAYTKSVLEELLRSYFAGKIKVFNLRLEYVYGQGDDTSKFIPFAVEKLRNNEGLNMSGGKQRLDFIHVDDCAQAIVFVTKNVLHYPKNFEEFEIGTGKTTRLKEFIEEIKKRLKSQSVINYGAVPYRENEQLFSRADIGKLKGWKSKIDIKKGIGLLIEKDRKRKLRNLKQK